MVDVSRRSNFLPILKDYHSNIKIQHDGTSLRPHQWQATAGIRQLMEQTSLHATADDSQLKQQSKVKKRMSRKNDSSKTTRISVDGFKRQYEMELRKRKNKRLENVLRTWDASLQWERDQRYHYLHQRVRVQRELIAKNDQLSDELRKKADDDQTESIETRKRAQKEMAEAMRAHIIRVEQHKKKIAEKLKEISQTNHGQDPSTDKEAERNTSNSPMPRKKLVERQTKFNDGDTSSEESESPPSSPLMQILGDSESNNTYSIGAMWGERRADAVKRLQPIVRYSHQLKQVASPSVKQFLDIYEKPTALDQFTGKPIPLGQVVESISQATSLASRHTTMLNAIQVVLNQTEMKANMMLKRKDPYNHFDSSTRNNNGWFVLESAELEEKPLDDALQDQVTIDVDNAETSFQQQRTERSHTNTEVKKHLPTYLTDQGDLVSGSLEEIGDYVGCGPSKVKSPSNFDSVFLTDLKLAEDDNNEPTDITMKTTSSSHVPNESGTPMKFASKWQPLSCSALAENKHVTEVPVKGLGHLAHGKYKLWRPDSCIVSVDQSN